MWLIPLFTYVITFIVTISSLIYLYAYQKYSTFKKGNVSYTKPKFPYGNMKPFVQQKDCLGVNLWECYKELRKQTSSFGGFYFFLKPMIIPLDPELIKTIFVKDFASFADKRGFADENVDPISGHLLYLKGEKWKKARTILTPTFSSGKIKSMFSTILNTTHELKNLINQHEDQSIDGKDMFSRQAMDTIGSCVFGLDCNNLKDPDTEFRKYGLRIFEVDDASIKQNIVHALIRSYPKLVKLLKLPTMDPEISNFFIRIIKQTIEHREEHNVHRNDFLDNMIQLLNKHQSGDTANGLGFFDVVSHSFSFLGAGYETTSATLTFCSLELCLNPGIQEKVRNEILDVLKNYDGVLTYDGIMEMKYMDKVIHEVLRKYPAIPVIQRECTRDYKMPNSDFVVKKGTNILLPLLGLHRDPAFYPNPDKFDPERFSEEEKAKRHPFVYLPFGAGPRVCIGMRFALLHVKSVISMLLMSFKFTMDHKTVIPIVFNPKGKFLTPRDPIWLKAERI